MSSETGITLNIYMPEVIYPTNDRLKKYIRYIYRVSSDDRFFERQLMIFPNVGSAMAIYRDVDFVSESYNEFRSFEKSNNRNVILHLNRKDPVIIRESGRQNRIVIVFWPLGINHFTDVHMDELLQGNNPTLIPLISVDKNFEKFNDLVPMDRPLSQSAPVLEELLLERFTDFQNAFLKSCVETLMNPDEDKKIEEMALEKKVSPKTINRLFHKHVGLSPVEFRKIVQFRNAVHLKLENTGAKQTDIALAGNYYDLPYMMRVFKQMTHFSATDFFNKISFSADKQYIYIS